MVLARGAEESEILRAATIDELKRHGSFKEVKAKVRVRARGWADLLAKLQALHVNDAAEEDLYFVSPAARVIFALLETETHTQNRQLGITRAHFRDRALARSWRDEVARLVHPDRCSHPHASRAMAEATKIYRFMVGQ